MAIATVNPATGENAHDWSRAARYACDCTGSRTLHRIVRQVRHSRQAAAYTSSRTTAAGHPDRARTFTAGILEHRQGQ